MDDKIKALEKEIQCLKQEKNELEHRVRDFNRMQDEIYFPWAGNLGTWRLNIKTHEVIPNPLKVEALGYTMEELEPVYQFFTKLIHPDDYEPTMEAMQSHLRGDAAAYEAEYRIETKDGEWKWFYDRGIVTEYNDDGTPVWLTGIVFDISEQKEKETELKRLISEKDKFFSILAHDLKNPFSVILGLTEMLSQDFESFSKADIKEYSHDLYVSANRLYKLLENLLEWARVQRGIVEYKPKSFQLHSLVYETVELAEVTARKKEISILCNIPLDAAVFADKNMVRTILRNLLNNAIKFTAAKGKITVSAVTQEDDQIVVAVKDTGVGMDTEQIKSIFSLSGQSSTSRSGTADESGTGLGLVLCKELVERNGGEIWVESEYKKGSVFYFTLPFSQNDE